MALLLHREYLLVRQLFFLSIRCNCHDQKPSYEFGDSSLVLPVLYECITSGAALGVLSILKTSKKLRPALFFWSIFVTFE
jgi:hypothetical protein